MKYLPLVLLLCLGCTSVPEELSAGVTVQRQALERVEEGRTQTIKILMKEWRTLYGKYLDAVYKYEVQLAAAATSQPTVVSTQTALDLAADREAHWQSFTAILDAKEAQLLTDQNMETLKRLQESMGRWVTSVSETAENIRKVIEEGGALIGADITIPR